MGEGRVGWGDDVGPAEKTYQMISPASLKLWLDEVAGALIWIFLFGAIRGGRLRASRALPKLDLVGLMSVHAA